MSVWDYVIAVVLSLLPISELRGAIPWALARGMPWPGAYALCVGANALVAPLAWLFLNSLHRLFLKMAWYSTVFARFVAKTQKKIGPQVERWGWLGIAVFIAIPLPITGAWTGSLGAWLLGLGKRKTFLAASLGVIVAGIIVSLVAMLGLSAFSVFLGRAPLN